MLLYHFSEEENIEYFELLLSDLNFCPKLGLKIGNLYHNDTGIWIL
jgi:hypothetical protein